MDRSKVRERKRNRREEARRWQFDGAYVASLVAARLAGVPAHAIAEYRALEPRNRYNKRNLFSCWIEIVDKQAGPKLLPYDWLKWETLAAWKKNETPIRTRPFRPLFIGQLDRFTVVKTLLP